MTVRDDVLEFTLTSLWLKAAWDQQWKLRSEQRPSYSFIRATFNVTKGGDLQTNWTGCIRHLRDATGNSSRSWGYNFTTRAVEIMNQFDGPELPSGEAWRLEVEFSRLNGFAPQEVLTLTHMPLPTTGNSRRLVPVGTNLLEVRFDPPDNTPGPYVMRSEVKPPTGIFMRGDPMHDYRLTLLSVTDDQGRNVPFENRLRGKNLLGGLNVTAEVLSLPAEARSLNLVFGHEPIRRITFQARPEVYTNAITTR